MIVNLDVRVPAYTYHNIWIKEHGSGPWLCNECNDLVYKIGRSSDDGHVHHKDHDRTNASIDNLEMLHGRCHQRRHKLGQRLSEEHKAKIGASSKGRRLSAAARAKVSAAQLGRPKSDIAKENIRQAQLKSRYSCALCGFTTTKSHMRSHVCR